MNNPLLLEESRAISQSAVVPGTVKILWWPTGDTVTDDGQGHLSGSGGDGTIGYRDGSVVMKLNQAKVA